MRPYTIITVRGGLIVDVDSTTEDQRFYIIDWDIIGNGMLESCPICGDEIDDTNYCASCCIDWSEGMCEDTDKAIKIAIERELGDVIKLTRHFCSISIVF